MAGLADFWVWPNKPLIKLRGNILNCISGEDETYTKCSEGIV